MELKPISFSGGVKSISDDDLCATCRNCQYRPGELSGCIKDWPGLEDQDGYVQQCGQFAHLADVADAWTKEDSQAAQLQGWDLFEASAEGKIVSLIERCDEMGTFEDDDKALEFVKQQAAAGNPMAAKALRLDHECSASAPAVA